MRTSRSTASVTHAFAALTAFACALVGCGGGSGRRVASAPTVPSRLSAVPVDLGPETVVAQGAARSLAPLAAPGSFGAPGTDYSNANAVPYVVEPALDQFDELSTLFNVIGQTDYQDHLGQGPYLASVSWPTNNWWWGQDVQQLTWTVQADAGFDGNGDPATVVQIWEHSPFGTASKDLLVITDGPAKGAGNSDADYGVWTLNCEGALGPYFAASAARVPSAAPGGGTEAVLAFTTGSGNAIFRQGVVHRDLQTGTGYGRMFYPRWTPRVGLSQTTFSYVYNADQLLLHQDDTGASVYKDRTVPVPIALEYGLFDAGSGADIRNSNNFRGFTVSFSLQDGGDYTGLYSSRAGLHELYSYQAGPIPDGTVVTRTSGAQAGKTYKTVSIPGSMTAYATYPGTLDDLQDVEIQIEQDFQQELTWDGTQWLADGQPFEDLPTLEANPMRQVAIAGPGGAVLVYAPYAETPGFYQQDGSLYQPAAGDQLEVEVDGDGYITYRGPELGWVQKRVVDTYPTPSIPVFDPYGDTAYVLELGRKYLVANRGVDTTVVRTGTGSGDYEVKLQVRTTLNPGNATALLGKAVLFRDEDYKDGKSSTYRFINDPTAPDYLALTYKDVQGWDSLRKKQPNDIREFGGPMTGYTSDLTAQATQFEWTAPTGSLPRKGVQTLLYSGDPAAPAYELLSDPIPLAPLTLTVNGQPRTVSLAYDGSLYGLPNWTTAFSLFAGTMPMTAELASKIINIPDGTMVTNRLDGTQSYVLKQVNVPLYLEVAGEPDGSLDPSAAEAIDLGKAAPPVEPTGMGDDPLRLPAVPAGGN